MKKTYILISILVIFTACKDFLSSNPEDVTENENILSTYDGLKSALNGCYSQLQSYTYYGRNFIMLQEVYSDNAKPSLRNTGQYNSFYSQRIASNNAEVENFWYTAYSIIANCNNILSTIKIDIDADVSEKNQLYGEAYALRAFVYFDLIRTFAQTYTYTPNAQHIGVPVVTEPFSASASFNVSRESVDSVYSQIESDLLIADSLLQAKPISPFTFNSSSVKSLLSLLYITKEDYNQALSYAEDVIYNYNFSLIPTLEYTDSWLNESNSESIFSIAMTATDYPATNSIGHMLSPQGYGAIIPSEDLTGLYSSKDVRVNFLLKEDEQYFIKYAGRNNTLGLDNIPVIRLSELYLIQAECYAQKAKTVASYTIPAQQSLLAIVERADTTVHFISETDNDLINKIHSEYRKEFAFEGKRLFQLNRWKQNIQRIDCNSTSCELEYPNNYFIMPIPQAEINANDSITQNLGY